MSLSDAGQNIGYISGRQSGSPSEIREFIHQYENRPDARNSILRSSYGWNTVQEPSQLPPSYRNRATSSSVMATPSLYRRTDRSTSLDESTTGGTSVPGLTNGGTSASGSSVCTGDSSLLLNQNVLTVDQDGALTHIPPAQPRPIYPCSFHFLRCPYWFDNVGEWYTHCLSHFRGHEPPKTVRCPYCTTFGPYQFPNGLEAWRSRMNHIANAHVRTGVLPPTVRPDIELFQHLWRKRIINDAESKELYAHHTLSEAPPYTLTQGSSAEERRRPEHQRQRRPGERRASDRAVRRNFYGQ